MRTILAPMEGVVDAGMRAVLTQLGGYHRCVTEFIRVTEQRIPKRVFVRFAPELEQGGSTAAGTPVYLQLLGGNAYYMGVNAARAAQLAPAGIDLNFGCPSKTVNRNDGGSALLREPQRIADIVKSVRDAVDPAIPVTAKIRLGFSNSDYLLEIAHHIESAGANELCIHARTREDRYKPPAYWSLVKSVSDELSIPVIINGEIWTISDALKAREQSGCGDIMLGRGALSFPQLAACLAAHDEGRPSNEFSFNEILVLLREYLAVSEKKHPMFVGNRAKQWLVFLQMNYPDAKAVFHQLKRLKEAGAVFQVLDQAIEHGPVPSLAPSHAVKVTGATL
ncbi:tRNA dihydrouridine synthase [Arenicella xantha]|uniref:tRNA-dihydrouridine(16) synthase n=1 Tax=Arenicella xantha TaxID=644221 RepID=A0A395JLB8_9GAMM|nr:tRNA-dihydrouridine synthase [Arenicella xantha]RBP48537.1 tRNA-U20a,U20b-dihydrouridine synthase [Arenicella xantha]